jgi:UDP:flavonoid glycosyltransferase YjiC (YdhE family)
MSHFGVLSYKGTGHLNPLIALSRELLARGHKVTFFQRPELEQLVRPHGLEFSPIGTCGNSYGEGAAKDKQRVSSGTTAFRSGIRRIAGLRRDRHAHHGRDRSVWSHAGRDAGRALFCGVHIRASQFWVAGGSSNGPEKLSS